MKKRILFLVILITCFYNYGTAQRLRITGLTWTPTITAITEAGNNYASSTLQSAANQTLIDVRVPNTPGFNGYIIQIRRTDNGTNWDTALLELSARRTGTGVSGGGTGSTVTGGDVYQKITTNNVLFFGGSNANGSFRNDIPIQYQISGISVLVPVGTYSTTITYTLIDN
ncbi:MAG: hypothetical protein U5M51_12795 [Emticicia sp.]|nr:hypothetical protein [Emticicia sp.]